MAAITYGAGAPAAKAATTKPAASLWTRLWSSFVEARTRQAMREIALHRHLLPAEMEATYKSRSSKINP